MAGYTKLDFDNNYWVWVERQIMAAGVNLDLIGLKAPTKVRLRYHSAHIKPMLVNRWSNIVPALLNIQSTDKVVVVGAAFGWGVDALVAQTGCTAVGVDISDYIATAGLTDENAQLIASIQEVPEYMGISPQGLSPRGQAIYDFYAVPDGVARTISVVLKEDMFTPKSRNEVKKALGNAAPTFIVTEDMIQQLSDVEITAWVTEAEKLPGATIAHIISKESPRTVEELNTLTGHKVILVGEYRSVG